MEVNNIDKYFSFDILRRGYDYYKKGKVKEIAKYDNKFSAVVNGTDKYKVDITLNKDKYDMKCTCPYAEKENCKHMAAVLYCLKNQDLLIKTSTIDIPNVEISDFEKFKKNFKREYNKLFHNRSYIYENELDDYEELVGSFIKETIKYIDSNIELAYDIFEYLLIDIDALDVYDEFGQKENMINTLFESFEKLFDDEKIFVRFLAFIGTIYTMNSDDYYFNRKEYVLSMLCRYIKNKWQAEDTLILLQKMNRDNKIYDYQKRYFKANIVFLTYYFIDKTRALKIAEYNLDIDEICEFLLDIYKDDQNEQVRLLEKIIDINKLNDKYYEKLLNIYKENDKEKYLDLLNKYFIKSRSIEVYKELKNNYSINEWDKIKHGVLEKVKDARLYREICAEEGYYDELLGSLKDTWIDVINQYLDILIKYKPNELLELYKNKLIIEIDNSSCRSHYQKVLTYFNEMNKIPNSKKELEIIFKYIREKYKNRTALQEELDFYEQTYL